MIIKKFAGIMLAVMLFSTLFSMNVGAAETPRIPAATEITLQSIDAEGSVNNQMTATIRLAIDGNGFNFTNANWNARDWFENLPVANPSERSSWAVRVYSDVQTGARTMTITLTGKPTIATTEPIRLKIPASRIQRGTTGIPEEDTPVTLTKNIDIDIDIDVSSPTDINVSSSDSDFKWNIADTDKVTLKVNEPKRGTLTATATVNGKTVSAATTSKEDEAVLYVTPDDEITFTAKPASRFTLEKWGGLQNPPSTSDSSDVLTFKRTFRDLLASDIITAVFTEVPTEYRILSVPVDSADENYTVEQIAENDKDATRVYKGASGTGTRADDDLIVMKFGETAPIIIKKEAVNVATDKKVGDSYVLPTGGEYDAPYNLTIASKNTAAVKVEVVPAENTTAYTNLVKELNNYADYSAVAINPGDLIITPQGAGTSAITITAKRENDTNTPKLSDGKIEFNIKVEMPVTEKDFDAENGILTAIATDIYGNTQTLELDIIKESATSDVPIAGYSVNGTSWTAFTINTTDTDISKIFDKGGKSLKFTSIISGSKSAPGATIWDIGEVGSRPSSPKLKVFYGNPTGITDGDTWTVTGFDYAAAIDDDTDSSEKGVSKLLFASSADKKTADTNAAEIPEDPTYDANAKFDFILFGKDDRFPLVKDLSDNKVVKSTYLFKFSASWEKKTIESDSDEPEKEIYVITPASKTVKLTVSSKLKPVKAKVDYKKGKVTLKTGVAYYYGEAINGANIENKTITEIIDIINNSEASAEIKIMTKSSAKSGILFRDTNENTIGGKDGNALLDGNPGSASNIIYWTAADGKKPQSAATIITVHNYRAWETIDTDNIEKAFIEGSGKYKLPKGYEARLSNEEKWKSSISLKKLSLGDNTVEIRKKGNANFDAKNTSTWLKAGTSTASEFEEFTFTVDSYTTSKGKSKTGITYVKLSSYNAAGN